MEASRPIANKPVIGIAGGIGSGKSTVALQLGGLGCVVVDSDALGRAALEEPSIIAELTSWWGNDILDADGHIDRRKVAAIVFRDPAERQRLEALTHPWIETRRRQQFEAAPQDAPALVIDAPLIFEAGLQSVCDAIIFVQTSRKERLRRVQTHRGWDDAELQRREDSQLPLDEKHRRADYVIQNEGDVDQLAEQCRQTLKEIIKLHRTV